MREKPKILGATGSAAGLSTLSLIIGTCCAAPLGIGAWVVTLLGVGGAVMLARLAFIQPYVVAMTLVLIGFGFWLAYRRQPAAAGESCPVENRTRLRWVVWISALAVIVIDIASFAPRFLS